MTAVIAITSGKAHVGRSLLSVNLAHYLNQKGYRTGVLVAGSSGPIWSVAPNTTWPNIIGGRLSMDHAIERNIFGIDLMVTRGHGHALGNLSTSTAESLVDPLGLLNSYAYLFVDMAAGTSSSAIACCLAATEAIMVLTPETPSLTAGYEWLAKLSKHGYNGPINILLNQVRKPAMAQTVYARFRDLAYKRLNVQSNLWGSIPIEGEMDPNDLMQRPLTELLPHSRMLQAVRIIGDRLLAEQPPENQTMPLDTFWRHFIEHMEKLPVMSFKPPAAANQQPAAPQPEPGTDTGQASPTKLLDQRPSTIDSPSFQKLEEQLTAIFDELRVIRRLLEQNPAADPPPTQEKRGGEMEQLPLDFDDFVKGQVD